MPSPSIQLPGEPLASVFKAEVPVEFMRLGQPFIAGHFDHCASSLAKVRLRGLDQSAADALPAKLAGHLKDRDSSYLPWAMDRQLYT